MGSFFPRLVCGMPCPEQRCGESTPWQSSVGFVLGRAHKARLVSACYSWNPSGMPAQGSNSMEMRPKSRNILSGLCKKPKLPIVGVFWQSPGVQRPQTSSLGHSSPGRALSKPCCRSFGKEGKRSCFHSGIGNSGVQQSKLIISKNYPDLK